MESRATIEASLAQFTGTENVFFQSVWRKSGVLYTEGVRALLDLCQCFWLLDAICAHQPQCRRDSMLRQMQFWTLTVEDNSGVLVCERDAGDIAIKQEIEYTDFPLDEIRIWLEAGEAIIDGEPTSCLVAMLPSER